MDRVHVRNGQVIARYNGEKGWLKLENGKKASPVVIGFVDGNDKVIPIVDDKIDNSTGSDVVAEVTTDWTIQTKPDRYYRLRTIRDKTATEITNEAEEVKNQLQKYLTEEPQIKPVYDCLYRLAKGNVPVPDDKKSFNVWFKGAFIK